jgi:hypothetical protein
MPSLITQVKGKISLFHYRLITAECDKTIKIWKRDPNATPHTHPIEDIRIPFDNK